MDVFESFAREKIAAENPAAPVKSSLPGMEVMSPETAYLNNGGGKAEEQKAGEVKKSQQPGDAYLNTPGGAKADEQVAGDINVGAAPDTGEKSPSSADMTVTKSAAFEAGVRMSFDDRD